MSASTGLPFGTRGGLAIPTFLPLDAEYTVDVETANAVTEPHEIELSVDGGRVAVDDRRRSAARPAARSASR